MSKSKSSLKSEYKQYCEENAHITICADNAYRIATFNIHYWTDVYDCPSSDKIFSDIAKINADVLCLEEVSFDKTKFNPYNYKELMNKFVDMGYKYSIEAYGSKYLGAKFGNMILSKLPISNTFQSELPLGNAIVKRAYCMGRIDKLNLDVCCLHLDVFDDTGLTRQKQIQSLLNKLGPHRKDLIICGDFNCIRQEDYETKDSLDMIRFRNLLKQDKIRGVKTDLSTLNCLSDSGYHTCFDHIKQKAPISTVWSDRTIDFIFVPIDFQLDIIKCDIYHTINSDHSSIYMDVKIKP